MVSWRLRLSAAERKWHRSIADLDQHVELIGKASRELENKHRRAMARIAGERENCDTVLSQAKSLIDAARQQHRDDEAMIGEILAENRVLQTTIDGLVAQNKTFEVSANAQIAGYVRRQVAAMPKVEE